MSSINNLFLDFIATGLWNSTSAVARRSFFFFFFFLGGGLGVGARLRSAVFHVDPGSFPI